MNRFNQSLTKIVLGTILAVFSGSIAQAQQLTGSQIEALLKGKCTAYWGPSEGTECFRANGGISYNDKSDGKGSGGWTVSGNRLCTKYDTSTSTECSTIRKVGENQYTDGSYTWRVTN